MENKRAGRVWRWVALFSVLFNIGFNYLYPYLPISGSRLNEVTNNFQSLFRPAGYAFSIWGAIFLSFLVYSIYQLLPDTRNDKEYDRITIPFILTNLLCAGWVYAFSNQLIGTSVMLMAAMLLLAGILFGKTKEAYLYDGGSFWVTVPFSLFLGWISVAAIANVSILLLSLNYKGGELLGQTEWTAFMIAAAFLLAMMISYAYREFVYPATIAWGFIAIWANVADYNEVVADVAMGAGVTLIAWSLIQGVMHFRSFSLRGNYADNSHLEA